MRARARGEDSVVARCFVLPSLDTGRPATAATLELPAHPQRRYSGSATQRRNNRAAACHASRQPAKDFLPPSCIASGRTPSYYYGSFSFVVWKEIRRQLDEWLW